MKIKIASWARACDCGRTHREPCSPPGAFTWSCLFSDDLVHSIAEVPPEREDGRGP